MIPYRFSFLFSFVVLVMAYRGYQLKKRPRWQVALSMVLFLGLAACSDQRLDPVFLIYNLGFCALYGGLLLAQKRPRKVVIEEEDGPTVQIIPLTGKETHRNRLTAQALLGVMALELAASVVVFGVHFGGHRHLQLPQRQGGHGPGAGAHEGAGGGFSLLPGGVHPHSDPKRRRPQRL